VNLNSLFFDPSFITLILSVPVGLAIFLLTTQNIQAHLKSVREKISFFFWPFPPIRMLIIRELDGAIRCFYDNDFEEIHSKDMTYIKCVDGSMYVTKKPPSQSSINVSLFDARAPAKTPSPFSYAWRWCVAAAFTVYFVYYALIDSWLGKPFMWQKAMISTIAFTVAIVWMIMGVFRMNDENIQYSIYHSIGINPPHEVIVPSLEASNLRLIDYLELLGKKVEIRVPSELKDLIQKLEDMVGSKNLASILLSRIHMLNTWREASTLILQEKFDIRKLGETSALIRMKEFVHPKRIVLSIILTLLIGLGIGFAVGYITGQSVKVEVQPAGQQGQPAISQPSQPQGPPSQGQGIQPAPMPQPPTNSTWGGRP